MYGRLPARRIDTHVRGIFAGHQAKCLAFHLPACVPVADAGCGQLPTSAMNDRTSPGVFVAARTGASWARFRLNRYVRGIFAGHQAKSLAFHFTSVCARR